MDHNYLIIYIKSLHSLSHRQYGIIYSTMDRDFHVILGVIIEFPKFQRLNTCSRLIWPVFPKEPLAMLQ
jgi:hypothetical protein